MGFNLLTENGLPNIGVISHDAGASEILVAYIKKNLHKAQWTLYAIKNSPFETICLRENLKVKNEIEIEKLDALFFGTGWQNRVEAPFVIKAKNLKVPTFAFLDHWSAYRQRFGYPEKNWQNNLADFTVVSDGKAQKLALSYDFFSVLKIDNYYLKDQIKKIKKIKISQTKNLLFLSEPTDEVARKRFNDSNYWGFTQTSALEDILKHFKKFSCEGINIRLHPSEKKHQYANILKKFPHIKTNIYPASFYPLEKDILRSKAIVGFDTMALYSAALFHKPVISYLPSKNREFVLPLPSSHQLRSLKRLSLVHLQPLNVSLEKGGMKFASILELIKGFKR